VKILFDQGTPVPLRKVLVAHLVVTAYELGWSERQNGDLTPYSLSLQIRNFQPFLIECRITGWPCWAQS
jgi:hypothetical protein